MLTPFWSDRTVLVTGGAGLIGSYLVEHLVADDARVRVADNLDSGSVQNLASCLDRVELVKADLSDPKACRKAVAGMEAVFDLAARTVGIGYSSNHHGQMLHHSLRVSMNILEASREAGVKRFLVTSSSCVYPDGSPVPTPESAADRNRPEAANAGYGWAKRVAEIQGMYYQREYGMEVAIVRLVNAYGPRYHWDHEEPHVIPALMQRLLRAENPLVIWGSGRQTRSFIHARDAAMAMKLVLERTTDGNPTNIGWAEETTIAELVEELTAVAGYHGRTLFDTTKPEGPARKALDLTRQWTLIPEFRPTITLREGLRQTWEAAQQFYGPQPSSRPARRVAAAPLLALR